LFLRPKNNKWDEDGCHDSFLGLVPQDKLQSLETLWDGAILCDESDHEECPEIPKLFNGTGYSNRWLPQEIYDISCHIPIPTLIDRENSPILELGIDNFDSKSTKEIEPNSSKPWTRSMTFKVEVAKSSMEELGTEADREGPRIPRAVRWGTSLAR
jgi:hypothetical protein